MSAMICERILEYVLSCVGKVANAVLTSGEQNPLEIENKRIEGWHYGHRA